MTATHDAYEMAEGFISDSTIKDAYFGYDAKYKNGEVLCLILEMETDEGETRTQLYPTGGTKWETLDGGKTITPVTPKGRNLVNAQSALGTLISYAIKCDGARDAMTANAVNKDDPTKEAGIWKGLSFTFETVKFTAKINGDDVEWSRQLPVEFIGSSK
jgi:hypothetical protein